jgi:4'-phosphopantetheinyl transferase EntD
MSDPAADAVDPALQRALDALAPPGLLIGHRVIAPGDERALLPEEAAAMTSVAAERRQASGAARQVARALMTRLGYGNLPIPKGPSGAPIWPAGLGGSLAHDDRIAVAAVGLRRDIAAVGIDVEPAVPLPADMLALVATPNELRAIAHDPLRAKLLFAAKEAVYKAVHPLDGSFLEFHDIEVDLAGGTAMTRTGRALTLRYCRSPHVVVLASVLTE